MNYITFQTLVVLVCLTAGCGKEGVLPTDPTVAAQAPANNTVTAPQVIPPVVDTGVDVSITVYAKTASEAPVNGWATKTYTATAYCAQYSGSTYCWDDGVKTLQWTNNNFTYGPYKYTYFNLSKNATGWTISHGGLQADLMAIPTLIDNTLVVNMTYALSTVNAVLSTGSATTYDCVDTDGIVDCGNFVIDTTQAGL